jgi:hypothetical protein
MRTSFFYSLFLLLLLTHSLAAQEEQRCGTPTEGADYFFRFQHLLKQSLPVVGSGRIENEILQIPLIFHVIHNGEPVGQGANIAAEQIFGQIQVLNEDFRRKNADASRTPAIFQSVAADAGIEFYPAATDPEGNLLPEPGIRRVRLQKPADGWWSIGLIDSVIKPATIWNPTRYLNIWVIDNISRNIAGYAQFPDLSGLGNFEQVRSFPEQDGIVIRYNRLGSIVKTPWALPLLEQPIPRRFDRGRTLTHEMGHFLGLLHTFQGGCDEMNDYCDDTPKTPLPTSFCPDNPLGCNGLAMPQNFMDFTDDACMNLFTTCQVVRMRQVLAISPRRRELPNSNVGRGDVQAFLQKVNLTEQVRIFPNPVVGVIRIESPHPLVGCRYEISNLLGQVITSGEIESPQNEIRPMCPAAGIYTLRLFTLQGMVVQKMYWQ